MKLSSIIDLISNFVDITGNSAIDTILFFIAGTISFSVAFGIVGMIFDFLGLYDSDFMSDIHWFIRTIIFAFLTLVFIMFFEFITWLLSFELWVYLIASLCIVGIVIVVYLIKYKYNKHKYNTKVEIDDQDVVKKNDKVVAENSLTMKDVCPRCGAILVKRHGPYGDFYGCSNYPTTNCKYTRKWK